MAVRPLYNGTARVQADNNPAAQPTLNRYTFRVRVGAAPDTANEDISNTTFEAKAGTTLTLHYDIRKFGDGPGLDDPDEARIRIYRDDDSNDARTGAVAESADLIGDNALPRTGTFDFTPTESGTYRIQLEMQQGNGNFGATSSDWRIISDGFFNRGGISSITRVISQDKGRLRFGHDISTVGVTERGSAAPSVFALTMNSGGTDLEEAVRVDVTQDKTQNKQTATEVYKIKQRRNVGGTIDVNDTGTILSGTQHRTENKVGLLRYPVNNADTVYDVVVKVESNSALHANNTRQYDALGGQAASGTWVYFTGAGAGLTLTDFQTVTKTASFTVNPGGSIENVFVKKASTYSEDGSQIPVGSEDFSFIATADNMNVKCGRVLNARGQVLRGIFVHCTVVHEGSGSTRDSWGVNDANFKTLANGWVDEPRTVVVSTPPAGVHRITATAYFPGSAFGPPELREFSLVRTESGSPSSASAGKDWIAPATFARSECLIDQVVKAGSPVPFVFAVFDKDPDESIVFRDADSVPACKVYKKTSTGELLLFASPALTKRAGTIGLYDGTFTPSAITAGGAPEAYEVLADVTVGSFKRRYGESLMAIGPC